MFKALLARDDVTEVLALRGRVGVLAFHGGTLERVTDIVANEVGERAGCSYYGVLYPEDAAHVPSALVDPAHSRALAAFLDHVDVTIAVHGYGRRDRHRQVLLGGRNRRFARHLRRHLADALPDYEHLDELGAIPRELRGLHPRNPVNRTRIPGVQLELPPLVRWNIEAHEWSDTNGAARTPQVDLLVDSLVAAVSSWA